MVHRKSTYKLAYQKFNADICKQLWEENSISREKRRHDEMSHHSIDESDYECQCDVEEPSKSDLGMTFPCKKKETTRVAWNPTNEKEPYPSGQMKQQSSKNARLCQIQDANGTGFDSHKETDSSQLENRKTHHNNEMGKDREIQETTGGFEPPSNSFRVTPNNNPVEKRTTLSKRNNTNDHKIVTTQANRGVFKFSQSTGEYDLIPAQTITKSRQKNKNYFNKRKGSLPSRNLEFINVRPRTLSSSSISKQGKLRSLSVDREVTFSDNRKDILPFTADRELVSTRREPRLTKVDREMGYMQNSCVHCGNILQKKGVLV